MDLTIEKLLNLSAYKQARVVGGGEGLENIVTGVTIMEDLTIKEWLKGRELLVTSLLPVKNLNDSEMINFFDTLLDKNLSGVIVKIGKHINKIPQKLIEWGDKHSIPIIEIPRHVLYTDVMYPTMSEILEKQVNQLSYFKTIHEKFRDMSIKDYPVKKVIEILSRIIGNPVEIYDRNYNLILSTFRDINRIKLNKDDGNIVLKKNEYKYLKTKIEDKTFNQVVIEISSIDDTKAYLSVIELNKKVTEMEFLAVENACTNIALSMTKDIAIKEVEDRFMNDIVNDILFRNPKLNQTILKRANISGIDLFGKYSIAVLNIQTSIDNIKYDFKNRLLKLVKKYDGVYSLRDEDIIIFIREKEDINHKTIIKRFKEDIYELNNFLIENSYELNFIAGIGRMVAGYEEFIDSYQQAMDAINVGKSLDNGDVIFDYDELGAFKLISDISKINDVKKYIPLNLMALIDIDKTKNSELLKTLETYIKNKNHIKNTSKELFIHPKTVSYRLEQIKELVGIDLEDTNQLFEIQIGLKILSFLKDK